MVRAPSRDRGQHRSLRQLYRRCAVAAGVAACDGDRGLAPHLSGRWDVLRTGDAAVHHCAATSASDRGDVRGGEYPLRAQSWRFTQRADGLALRCGSCLLRGDGDAAGPHRRLLWRPRLRAGAWRRNAFGDARVRHLEPYRLGSDRRPIGWTLLIGSVLQGIALFLYLVFDGLVSLYIISALFGLFQGGIVPMYAIIVREYFSPKEVGIRIGIVLMATLFGMALGGWMSGIIFDYTGSYRAAFLNGLIWNVVNAVIVVWLLLRPTPRLAAA